jgi:hypothetical protein
MTGKMKTLTLKLKKDVLIVDLPDKARNIKQSGNKIIYCLNTSVFIENLPEGNFTFLCQGTPTEEQLTNLIDCKRISSSEGEIFPDFKNKGWLYGKPNRVKSFLSAVSAENWNWLVNPVELIERGEDTEHNRVKNQNEWQESESRTFKNPIIFIKE